MANSYVSVNHVSDELKTDGIVESYQMVDVEEDGGITKKRLNFVVWPNIPSPAFHEEWSEDLVFDSIFTPSEDEEESSGDEEIVDALKELHPEIYNEILDLFENEEEEVIEYEEESDGEVEQEFEQAQD
jgi:hypothetical protein